MLGLDCHDMRGLGDYAPGYNSTTKPTSKYGLLYLRMARKLEENFVITVEPGIYFIQALINKYKQERIFTQFINYSELEFYKDFGGIRIEDDILVTKDGAEVLSKDILK